MEVEQGAEILRILDEAGLRVKVALWALLGEYTLWRLVLASRRFDESGAMEGHGLTNDALRAAGFPVENKPPVLILPTNDPFIKALRGYFGKAKSVKGMRLGGQQIGNRWVEDGYVYRIS
jgi:hypothetical protein